MQLKLVTQSVVWSRPRVARCCLLEVGELPGRVMIKPWSREEEGEKRGGWRGGKGRGGGGQEREEGEEGEEGGVKVRS